MSPRSWVDSLKQATKSLLIRNGRPPRIAIVGIGHELRGDDAAGLIVGQQLQPVAADRLLIIEAGHAPENHTGRLRRFHPDLVLLVDCAQLDTPPGTICWLPWQETSGLSASTHTMPPYMLARFLTAELQCEVALIGIQPAQTTLGTPLSENVRQAVETVVQIISQLHAPGRP